MTVHVIDLESLKEINSIEFNAGYVTSMFTKDDNLYMLLNRTFKTDFNLLIASYNYKEGKLNWSKTEDNNWGKILTRSYKEGTNDIGIVHGNKLDILDASNGNMKESFDTSSDILEVYSYLNNDLYLTFSNDGSVNYISMETKQNIIYKGKFVFNLDKYTNVVKNKTGYLLVPQNENRVIYYEANSNKDIKETKLNLDYVKSDSLYDNEVKKLKEKYNVKNQNLVSGMFYSAKKDILFVSYTDEKLAVYNAKTKELINTIEGISKPDHYYGKDKYGRTYIGTISNAYILDKDYNKVSHIVGLAKVEKDKVIIANNSKYYILPIYTLEDLLKLAKDYLK